MSEIDFRRLLYRTGSGEEIAEEEKKRLYAEAEQRRVSEWTDAPRDEKEGVVYYVRFCCRIKIGHTTNLRQRLASLPCDEVMATESGGRALETRRHSQFGDSRIDGTEWFHMSPDLVAHVRALSVGRPDLNSRLIDTPTAMAYTGRERQVLYRWAREGRVTRYGQRRALWDVWELPPCSDDGSPGPPPKIRKKNPENPD